MLKGNVEVIKLAHGIYQLSLKFKESLDKVKENRKAVEEFERQILRPIQYLGEKFELLHDRGSQYEELRSELTVLRSELDSLLQKCKDMELHRGLTFKAWWNSDKIKGEIDSIQKRLESCRQIYLVHASFRTEIVTKESSKKLDNVTDMLRRVIPQPGTSLKPPSIHNHLPPITGPVTLNLNFPNVSVEKVYNTITTATPKRTPPAHAQTKHKSCLTLPKINVYGPSESDGHSSVKRTERGVQATTKTVHICSQNNGTQDAQAPVTAHQAKEMKEMAKSLSQAVDRRISRSRSVVGRSYSLKTSIARRAPRERQVDLSTTSLDAIIHGTSIMTLLNAKALEADIVAVELDRLSVKLCELGDYHGACDMSRKAAQVLQDVCVATKNEPSDTYATALHNLAIHLSHVGLYKKALLSAREAVTMYTHLRTSQCSRNPVLEANLALSQLTLANCLSYNGNTKEALTSARQSVDIYQSFSGPEAVEFRADLAMSLVNYADKLRAAGQVAAAQFQAQSAIDIYMRLRKTHASKYGAEYAAALSANAKCFHSLKHHDEALGLVKAGIAIWRALEHSRPGRFSHHLADSLMEAQAIHSSLGAREEASRAAKEGVSLFRKLANGYPDRFNQHLASSLTCAGRAHVRAKDFLQAIKFFKEAIDIYERPTLHIVSDIQRADILEDVAQSYRKLTNFAEAQKYSKMAVEKQRQLLSKGKSHPNVLALARSLRELAISRSEGLSFKPDNVSLQLLTESISLYRSLSQVNYRSDLVKLSIATSLQELAALQAQLKLHEEAVGSACEAVRCFAHLTQTRPDLRSDFAHALLDHSVIHFNLGFLSDALETATQAVSLAEVMESNDRQELLAKARKQVVACCGYLG